ncbi:MAG: cysteine synthase A [Clostridia bacterium]|nr:cysteine synthase A [Clostridia bacterium]
MKIYNSVSELVGRTPLLRLRNIEAELGLGAALVVKIESANPAGSAKDRVAKNIIEDAERKGKLVPGSVIIEPTSGNTGIGLAAIAASRGYRTIVVMPSNMSNERKMLIRAYGAELIETPAELGMTGAIKEAERINSTMPNSIIAGQFVNPANPEAHKLSTAPEIWQDTDGKVDIFVAGIGTGGTATGIGEYLKERKPGIRVVGVEPSDSPVLTEGRSGKHGIQGIGAGFIPEILNTGVIDEVIAVTLEDSVETMKLLAKKEGVLAGISSGAALYAGISEAKKEENKGKTIVVLLPDSGERYLSAGVF